MGIGHVQKYKDFFRNGANLLKKIERSIFLWANSGQNCQSYGISPQKAFQMKGP